MPANPPPASATREHRPQPRTAFLAGAREERAGVRAKSRSDRDLEGLREPLLNRLDGVRHRLFVERRSPWSARPFFSTCLQVNWTWSGTASDTDLAASTAFKSNSPPPWRGPLETLALMANAPSLAARADLERAAASSAAVLALTNAAAIRGHPFRARAEALLNFDRRFGEVRQCRDNGGGRRGGLHRSRGGDRLGGGALLGAVAMMKPQVLG